MAKFALLIGVGNYDYPNAVRPLSSAHQDVAALQRVLLDPELGSFSEAITLLDPDPYQMQTAIETLFRDRQKEDLLLLYYSGHGFKDDGGNLHFSTRVTQKTSKGELVKASAVPTRFIHEVLADSKSKRQVVILDCCYSGAFDLSLQPKGGEGIDLWKHLGAEGRIALTSSSSTQYSYEVAGTELSLYTRYLVQGIESGAADRVGDGKISVHDLHEYVTAKLQEAAPSMNPKMITLKDEGFDIILAEAKVLNPQLRYRRETERFARQAEISQVGRAVLDTLREQLKLPLETTREIEEQVLRPYRKRLQNRARYGDIFRLVIGQENPLPDRTRQELSALQNILGLHSEEVRMIEEEVLTQQPSLSSLAGAPTEIDSIASKPNGIRTAQQIGAVVTSESTRSNRSRSQPESTTAPFPTIAKGMIQMEESQRVAPPSPQSARTIPSRSRWMSGAGVISMGTALVGAIGIGSVQLQPSGNQPQRSVQQIAALKQTSFSECQAPTKKSLNDPLLIQKAR